MWPVITWQENSNVMPKAYNNGIPFRMVPIVVLSLCRKLLFLDQKIHRGPKYWFCSLFAWVASRRYLEIEANVATIWSIRYNTVATYLPICRVYHCFANRQLLCYVNSGEAFPKLGTEKLHKDHCFTSSILRMSPARCLSDVPFNVYSMSSTTQCSMYVHSTYWAIYCNFIEEHWHWRTCYLPDAWLFHVRVRLATS